MPQDLPNTYRHPLPNGLYYDMVRVRPGVFVMGSKAEEAFDWEKPEHLVRITQDYYIGIYPVTQAIWKAVMNGHNPSRFQGNDRPVEQVSWQDIVEGGQDEEVPEAFLPQLNAQHPLAEEGLSGFSFRLPTEAEYVARYCDRRGIDAIDHWPFYLAFGFFRFAAIMQGVYRRSLDGNASNARAAEYGSLVKPLARLGVEQIAA